MPYKDLEKRKQWAHDYIRRTDVKLRRAAMKNKKYAKDEEYREKVKATAREWQRKKKKRGGEKSRMGRRSQIA